MSTSPNSVSLIKLHTITEFYTHADTCTLTYTYTWPYIGPHMSAHAYIHIHSHTYACVHITYTCPRTCLCDHTDVFTYILKCVLHNHIYMCVQVRAYACI